MKPAKARLERRKTERALVPVVGIGASAGGLDAFTSLLKALPADTGMAFVLISHLMHEQKSVLGELLSKATMMPVSQLECQTVIKPNHVYVIPPKKELSIEDDRLNISPLTQVDRPSMVIDRFFRSLAAARASKAVGVILSGTGTDGTLGLAEIKAEGGITFVQNEESAAYSDMPRSAQSSADYVLSPELIAEELKRIAGHPYVSTEPVRVAAVANSGDILRQIFNLIKAAGGVNFSRYKQASIRRRIARRMVLKKIDSLASYLGHLRADGKEVVALYQDLLITVTEFFRDPDTFDVLKTRIVPQIFKRLPGDATPRVWVVGCASGEEAYSIAMCFAEAAARDRAVPPVQIFATDVSEQCIARARSALYPDSIAANISDDRLRRFFVKEAGGYRVSKSIRDLCIFAEQDVIGDAPFSRMDLVSCRNLLIYLDTPTQKDVLHRFHYALKPTGFLLLGTSESTAAAPELFEEVEKRERIYSKLPTASRIDFALAGHSGTGTHRALEKPAITTFRPSLDLGKEVDQLLLRRFAPSGVLLNSAMDILEFRGKISSVIEPEAGDASLNIFKMLQPELIAPLRVALHEAQVSAKPVVKRGLVLGAGDRARKIDLEVMRISPQGRGATYYLVLFEEPNAARVKAAMLPMETSEARLQQQGGNDKLKKELKSTQDHLRSIVEEQAKTNEELQSANEEVLASNEELQSMNEEMQTAKEELQATNEELHSVNDELQKRNTDLGEVNGDLSNLILSLDIASVLVDNNLRIRRFTPLAQQLLNLIPADLGRSIEDIRPKIALPTWPNVIADVVRTMSPFEGEVQDSEGHWYLMRIRPYRTEPLKIDGAVMFLVDVDKVKRAEAAVREAEQKLKKLVEQVPDFVLNTQGEILFAKPTPMSLAKNAKIGTGITEAVAADCQEIVKTCLETVRQTGEPSTFAATADDTAVETVITPVKSGDNIVAMMMTTR